MIAVVRGGQTRVAEPSEDSCPGAGEIAVALGVAALAAARRNG